MSFRIEKGASAQNSSFATPGESYCILASSSSLRKHLSDSYWSEVMDQVCSGKLTGVAVRYTGERLVFMQFRPSTLSPAGYRYPLFMSIPFEFLVPTTASAAQSLMTQGVNLQGSFGSNTASFESDTSRGASKDKGKDKDKEKESLPPLCTVCGRYNIPSMVFRPHGWKCKECKGKKSEPFLRQEALKLKEVLAKGQA
ncbi:hypothetical protein AGDE_03286 [Angomonas deanei]|uniref:Uncharacterized protein n=1 Tax=Angomonas deanei TaxID=59799 RepID=S9VCL0_9TRYP|nr:hypothetical protein AGDE_04332 [Angomonas deanei]EPY40642.1 hypothetical protein AGDE_03286 [Angomonas deanei]CAD2214969.1 hypothetical protein, conserved [Angomonas deanei]|eukprot:EPY39596.1 hypothetical protein AGDE_04332 [Angomonas deanei]